MTCIKGSRFYTCANFLLNRYNFRYLYLSVIHPDSFFMLSLVHLKLYQIIYLFMYMYVTRIVLISIKNLENLNFLHTRLPFFNKEVVYKCAHFLTTQLQIFIYKFFMLSLVHLKLYQIIYLFMYMYVTLSMGYKNPQYINIIKINKLLLLNKQNFYILFPFLICRLFDPLKRNFNSV